MALAALGWLILAACPPGADPCRVDEDCRDNELCVEAACLTVCNSDLDCGRRELCDDGVCWPEPDADAAGTPDSGADAAVRDASSADRAAADTTAADLPSTQDAARPDSAGDIDASLHPSGCGTIGALQDNFDDSQLGWQWSSYGESGVTAAERDGRLELSIGAGVADRFGWVRSDFAADLRGDAVSVRVAQAPTTAGVEAFLDFDGGQDGYISFSLYAGGLAAIVNQGGSNTAFEEIPYDAATHRFWRIGEVAGRVHLDTSPDRTSWTTHVDVPSPSYVGLGRAALGIGAVDAVGAADHVVFDDLNTDRAPPPWCQASGFSDAFDQGALSREWELFGPESCTAVQRGGHVTVGNGEDCFLYTARVFAFDQVLVELLSEPQDEPLARAVLAVYAPSGRWAELGVRGGNLHAWIDSGALLGDFPLLDRRWLRLRRSGTNLLFEARGSAGPWELLHSAAWSAGEGPVFAAVGLDCRDCDGDAHGASFDNFNLD